MTVENRLRCCPVGGGNGSAVALAAARFAALVRGVSADAALAQGGLFRVAGRGRGVAAARVGGRKSQPTAVVIDSRTLQSTPESGARAGYNGAKRRKGSKVHIAVDTLGRWILCDGEVTDGAPSPVERVPDEFPPVRQST
jgi:hypothetical protein